MNLIFAVHDRNATEVFTATDHMALGMLSKV